MTPAPVLYLFSIGMFTLSVGWYLLALRMRKAAKAYLDDAQKFKEQTAYLLAQIENAHDVSPFHFYSTSTGVGGITNTQISGRLH